MVVYDHYYGLGQLVARFPGAWPVATAPVVAYIVNERRAICL
jgi:hypothetical protein